MKHQRFGRRSKQRGFVASIPLIAAGIGAAASSSASRRAASSQDAATAVAQQQADMAREQWDIWQQDYRPLEQDLIRDAKAYDTPERREQAAATAMGNAQRSIDQAQRGFGDAMNERGVDPNSGQYQAGMRDFAIRGAAQTANAGNAARVQVENTGYARLASAADRGRGLVSGANAAGAAAGNSFAQLAAAQGQQANQQGAGIANLFDKGLNAAYKWWNTPSTGGGYNTGQWGTNGTGE
mgnify:FL=1